MKSSLMIPAAATAAIGAAVFVTSEPTQAQTTVPIPITGGNFTVRYNGETQNPAIYTTPPTFITPVGTLNLTNTPGLPNWSSNFLQSGKPNVATIPGINGIGTFNDDRTATYSGVEAKVQVNLTITGAQNTIQLPNLPGADTFVQASIVSGSLIVPQSAFSTPAAPQTFIPITNGNVLITIPGGTASVPVISITGLITPLGTANLTFSNPAFGNTLIQITDTSFDLGSVVTGIVTNPSVVYTSNLDLAAFRILGKASNNLCQAKIPSEKEMRIASAGTKNLSEEISLNGGCGYEPTSIPFEAATITGTIQEGYFYGEAQTAPAPNSFLAPTNPPNLFLPIITDGKNGAEENFGNNRSLISESGLNCSNFAGLCGQP